MDASDRERGKATAVMAARKREGEPYESESHTARARNQGGRKMRHSV